MPRYFTSRSVTRVAIVIAFLGAFYLTTLVVQPPPRVHPLSPTSPSSPFSSPAARQRPSDSPPPLYLSNPHCQPLDWGRAAASASDFSPETWQPSSLHHVDTPLGFQLALPPTQDSYVAEHIALSGIWAPVHTLIFLHILGSPKVRQNSRLVVDVGANLGYFSQLSLSMGFDVLGFEPQARAIPYLTASTLRNGYTDRFHLHQCAVGSVVGMVDMVLSDKWETASVGVVEALHSAIPEVTQLGVQQQQSSATTRTTPMITLADILSPGVPIALLKINVEGFEQGVFAGLTPQILRGLRNIVIEMSNTESRVHVQGVLEKAGFVCRQFQERYQVKDPATGNSVPGSQDTKMSRNSLGQVLASFLLPCAKEYNGPDDYFFSKEDWPWMCSTPGCT